MREALFAFLDSELPAGNPASTHARGRASAELVDEAAAGILATVHASPAEWGVVFVSGGTEANRLAVRTVLGPRLRAGRRPVWSVSEVEHSCVLDLVPEMEREGAQIRKLRPRASGEVSGIAEARDGSDLLSVIGVGNETGIFQQELTSHILSALPPTMAPKPKFHVDFVAGWGKADLDLSKPGAPDLVAIAGHKLGALSGAGALLHRKSISVERGGTPNLAGIVALKALADHWSEIRREQDALRALRDGFERDLRARIPEIAITGAALPRVANVSHFTIPGRAKDLSLVAQLDLKGFAVSAGSACASGAPEPSHVLLAMGLSALDAKNALRISLHPGSTAAELAAFLDALDGILERSSKR